MRRRALLSKFIALFATCCFAISAHSYGDSEPEAALPRSAGELAKQVLESGSYQTEFPAYAADSDSTSVDLPLWLAQALEIFFWTVLAGIGLLALAWVVWQLLDLRLVRGAHGRPAATAAITLSRRPLEDAEGLARAHRYDEAVHVLLLRSIEELRAGGAFNPKSSLTSREILAAAPLAAAQRDLFALLVSKVEISLFGRTPLGQSDYELCAAGFRELSGQ